MQDPSLWVLLLTVSGVACVGDVVTESEVVEGGPAELRCDASLPTPGDTLLLLVWYRSYAGKQLAVYSFDSRVPTIWCKDDFNASGRVSAAPRQVPGSHLLISWTLADDQALFHCRVDFQLSPTRNCYTNLTVIVLPLQPFVQNELGDSLNGSLLHQHEGGILILTCYVIGGRPPPQVRWYSGHTLLDATDADSLTLAMRENELYLPLEREHGLAPLQCRAQNTRLAPPRVFSLQVEVYVPAESVKISWEEGAGTLLAGRQSAARCVGVGAHPQPELTWWLNHEQLTTQVQQGWDAASRTAWSALRLAPAPQLDGAALSCVVTNVLLAPANATKSDTVTLNVLYAPLVEVVKAGGRANESEEGRPLALHCEARANPAPRRIVWYYNDTEISTSQELFSTADITQDLVVARAVRNHSGSYSCQASNDQGSTRSEELSLTVTYAPECLSPGVWLAGDRVECRVAAAPPADTFLWRARAAGALQEISTATPALRLSLLQGALDSPLQVWCEAANSAGSQRLPCHAALTLEHLRPPAPTDCDMTFELQAFHVHCPAGSNATYHVLSVWRLSASNSSLYLAWRARSAYGEGGTTAGGAVGTLGAGDEAGVAACNLFGCSADTLLRPTAALLKMAAPPWWAGMFEKDLGLSLGIASLVAVFLVSSLMLTRALGRHSRAKAAPPPVIQVLQLDDFTVRDYLDTIERKSRSHKSCSSVYSAGSLEDCPPLVERSRKPTLAPVGWRDSFSSRDCLPDLTAQLSRESAV